MSARKGKAVRRIVLGEGWRRKDCRSVADKVVAEHECKSYTIILRDAPGHPDDWAWNRLVLEVLPRRKK